MVAEGGPIFDEDFGRQVGPNWTRISKENNGWVSKHWDQILHAQREEVPDLREFVIGSFNIDLIDPRIWRPPNEGFFYARSRQRGLWLRRSLSESEFKATGGDFLENGNFIHPQIRVVRLNGRQLDGGRLYFAGINGEEWQKKTTTPWPLSRCHTGIEIIAKSHIRELLGLGPDSFGTEIEVELGIDW